MAHGNGIATGDHAHEWLAESWCDSEQCAFKQSAEQDREKTIAETGGDEDDSRQA